MNVFTKVGGKRHELEDVEESASKGKWSGNRQKNKGNGGNNKSQTKKESGSNKKNLNEKGIHICVKTKSNKNPMGSTHCITGKPDEDEGEVASTADCIEAMLIIINKWLF